MRSGGNRIGWPRISLELPGYECSRRKLGRGVRLNIFLAGMNPFYFHAVNVILHCLVTLVLMYTCDKTVFKNRGLAFVTALLFAVHPVHTEAVAGIVGRADVLACLLFLLAFLSYHRSLDQGCAGQCFPPTASPFFLLLSLFLGTCAMLVKETGVTVFGVCLVYDLFSPSHKQDKLSNGVICQHSLQQPGNPQSSSQHGHPHRESRKQRFPHKDTWGGCHQPLPPEPKSSGFPVSPGAVWSLMRGARFMPTHFHVNVPTSADAKLWCDITGLSVFSFYQTEDISKISRTKFAM
ncbi:transmembrane and tetratricopeptide repeat containing 1 [Cricetulus griseus]